MKPRILLTGATGQIGSELSWLLPALGEVVAPDRQSLDLADPGSIRKVIRACAPKLIVNAAAYTAVDRAETERALAHAVNAEAPAVIAEEAASLGAVLLHYSTDYVFDGTKGSPYDEADSPNPINVYGATKLAGELAVRANSARHFIFRTSWVYSTRGSNFLLTILKLAVEKEELRVVSDQIGAPTWSREIAVATSEILTRALREGTLDAATNAPAFGTYHMTAAGAASWFEFATGILAQARRGGHEPQWFRDATGGRSLVAQRVLSIPSRDYPTRARRPAYSVLSNAKLESTFGTHLRDWKSQLRAVFDET